MLLKFNVKTMSTNMIGKKKIEYEDVLFEIFNIERKGIYQLFLNNFPIEFYTKIVIRKEVFNSLWY